MTATAARLDRDNYEDARGRRAPSPPVRIVHLGLGAFHRAHQAWYTAHASPDWGIAAFTGRSPEAATGLAEQDGLYTLIERTSDGDTASVVTSIVEAVDGADLARFTSLLASPSTVVVTITVTEAGYRLMSEGEPDLDDAALASDVLLLSSAFGHGTSAPAPVTTLGRLVLGLDARRRSDAGPIAVVPCDNIPANGPFVERGLIALARLTSPATADWIERNVAVVSTSVDRITPATTDDDNVIARLLTGFTDASPVVTEPFRDWVLSGDFPAGRPPWEGAGAQFVDDIEPFERRKLWLLNGAHSLLAYAGVSRGHTTVAEAVGDIACRGWVVDLWDEAVQHLPPAGLDLDEYRQALLDRFGNSRIRHELAQVGTDGVTKLRVRIVPVAMAERAAGRDAAACARVVGAWIATVLSGRGLKDSHASPIAQARAAGHAEVHRNLLALVDADLARDDAFVTRVKAAAESFTMDQTDNEEGKTA